MKKVVFLLVAMFICFSTFAETNSHGDPKPKGYNYSQNRRNNERHHRKQMSHYRHAKGHICCGHRYKKQH
jgi:hypothetical protein